MTWTPPSPERLALIRQENATPQIVEVTVQGADLEPITVRDQDGSHFGILPNTDDTFMATKKITGRKVQSFVAKHFPAEYQKAGATMFGYTAQTPLFER